MTSPDKFRLTDKTVGNIVDSMLPEETREQMVVRRLQDQGVFYYTKYAHQPLPELPPNSGLSVEPSGIVYTRDPGGIIDSFIVYDPRRIELRIQEDTSSPTVRRRGSKPERQIDKPEDGWQTPFHGSYGRVVSYRPIRPTQP
jgi:hypothetical protein